jgi:hypothetical protein
MTNGTPETTETTYSPAAIKKQVAIVLALLKQRDDLRASIESQIAELNQQYSDETQKFAEMRGTGAFKAKGFTGSISSKNGRWFLKKLPNSEIEQY